MTKICKILFKESNSILASLVYILLVILAIVLPIILWQFNLPMIAKTYDGIDFGMINSEPFELFALLISIILIGTTWINVKKQDKKTVTSLTPIILPLLVSLQILFFVFENSNPKSTDYLCYENAAKAVLLSLNPYDIFRKCYLYPPLQSQVLSFVYQIVHWGLLFNPKDSEKAWTIVFYIYQCAQFLQIILAYYLTSKLARKMGLRAIPASLITSALFLFNNSLVRTIDFNQINVWILNCFLLSILWVPRKPFLGGLAVAVGAHIKLYTLALLLPWTLTKSWRAVLGVIVGFCSILILQTGFGQDWTFWQQFLDYFTHRLEKPVTYRNSGIWSLIYNLGRVLARFTDKSLLNLVPAVVTVINVLIIAWFIWRLLKREKAYRELVKANSRKAWSETYRQYGHAIDAVALGLLISPSVWEHHYVIAIPVALWAIVTRRLDQPWLVGVGTFMIFCLPTFDVFPLSHHRTDIPPFEVSHLEYRKHNFFKGCVGKRIKP